MGHLVYHAGTEGKMGANDVKGLVCHTFRKSQEVYETHGNVLIDKEMTEYNVDNVFYDEELEALARKDMRFFPESRKYSMAALIEDKAKYEYRGKRALQKNAVLAREIISNPSRDMFEGMDIEQQRDLMIKFSNDACKWMRSEFGERNVLGFSIHLDETHPHTHFVVMPMTEDGRISQKDFFKGPADMKRQHREYRKFMNERGWDFDMENKYEAIDNVRMPVYKANAKEIDELREKQTEALREARKASERLMSEDFIHDLAARMLINEKEAELREKLEREKKELEQEKKKLESQVEKLRFEVDFTKAIVDEKPRMLSVNEMNVAMQSCTDGAFGVLTEKRSGQCHLVDLRGKHPSKTNVKAIVGHVYEMDGKAVTVDMKYATTRDLAWVVGHYTHRNNPVPDSRAYDDGFQIVASAVYERQKEFERTL